MGKTYHHETSGTCSKAIDITVDDNGLIEKVEFTGGCNGNLKGIAALCTGKTPEAVAATLRGITCGAKSTSCPDQLARALAEIKNQ